MRNIVLLILSIIISSCQVLDNPEISKQQKIIEKDPYSIHVFNPYTEVLPKIVNIRSAWKQYGDKSHHNNLVLLHLSDFHAFEANMTRVSDFLDVYSEYIDDVIHTGDIVGNDISGKYPSAFDKDWLQVIGNHDATLYTENGYVIQPSITSYNLLFAPFIENWNVCQPSEASQEGKCYYYKDYENYRVRLIVLDCYIQGNSSNNHWNPTQKSWFEDVLKETLDSSNSSFGYHVLVAVHYPAFTIEKQPNNPFNSIDYTITKSNCCVADIPDIVQSFKQNGGSFICYLTGHMHTDFFGVGTQYPDQLCISIACASVNAAQPYCDMVRRMGDKTQDCFNLVGIDTDNYVIKLMRIGAEYDRYMRRRSVLCWNYKDNQLIYVD